MSRPKLVGLAICCASALLMVALAVGAYLAIRGGVGY